MGPAAHEIGSRTNVGDPGDPHNDETPDQIDSGREFRETETDSSGNYPNVRKGGVEPPRPSGHTDLNRARLPFRHLRVTPTPPYRVACPKTGHPGRPKRTKTESQRHTCRPSVRHQRCHHQTDLSPRQCQPPPRRARQRPSPHATTPETTRPNTNPTNDEEGAPRARALPVSWDRCRGTAVVGPPRRTIFRSLGADISPRPGRVPQVRPALPPEQALPLDPPADRVKPRYSAPPDPPVGRALRSSRGGLVPSSPSPPRRTQCREPPCPAVCGTCMTACHPRHDGR